MLFRQFLLGVLMTFTSVATAQELEPRAYSPSPVGLNFLIFTYAHQDWTGALASGGPALFC